MTGIKYDQGKVDYTLIPPVALREVAEALTYGATKYTAYNWVGVESTRYLSAAYRHLEAFRGGHKLDTESDLHHLALCITNLLFLLTRDMDNKDSIYGAKYISYEDGVMRESA